jgi:hypothetical protein
MYISLTALKLYIQVYFCLKVYRNSYDNKKLATNFTGIQLTTKSLQQTLPEFSWQQKACLSSSAHWKNYKIFFVIRIPAKKNPEILPELTRKQKTPNDLPVFAYRQKIPFIGIHMQKKIVTNFTGIYTLIKNSTKTYRNLHANKKFYKNVLEFAR